MPNSFLVRITSAPKACIISLRSLEAFSGITIITFKFNLAPIIAKEIPVFPLVASIITVSLLIVPFLSPSLIIYKAALSLILPLGFSLSNFAYNL